MEVNVSFQATSKTTQAGLPLMRPTDKKVVVARFEGRCSNCDAIIVPGQRIEQSSGGWMHRDCPADQPEPPDIRWDTDY